jgi:hypothetical protein
VTIAAQKKQDETGYRSLRFLDIMAKSIGEFYQFFVRFFKSEPGARQFSYIPEVKTRQWVFPCLSYAGETLQLPIHSQPLRLLIIEFRERLWLNQPSGRNTPVMGATAARWPCLLSKIYKNDENIDSYC